MSDEEEKDGLSEIEKLVADMTGEILELRKENRELKERLEKLEKKKPAWRPAPRMRYGISDE